MNLLVVAVAILIMIPACSSKNYHVDMTKAAQNLNEPLISGLQYIQTRLDAITDSIIDACKNIHILDSVKTFVTTFDAVAKEHGEGVHRATNIFGVAYRDSLEQTIDHVSHTINECSSIWVDANILGMEILADGWKNTGINVAAGITEATQKAITTMLNLSDRRSIESYQVTGLLIILFVPTVFLLIVLIGEEDFKQRVKILGYSSQMIFFVFFVILMAQFGFNALKKFMNDKNQIMLLVFFLFAILCSGALISFNIAFNHWLNKEETDEKKPKIIVTYPDSKEKEKKKKMEEREVDIIME